MQVKKPPSSTEESICPFCNKTTFEVVFRGPLSAKEIEERREEERKVRELEERMKEEERVEDEKREKRLKEEREERERRQLQLEQEEEKRRREEEEKRREELETKKKEEMENGGEAIDQEMRLAIQLSLQQTQSNTSSSFHQPNNPFHQPNNPFHQPNEQKVGVEEEEELIKQAIALSLEDK